jgi:hypothetical protein
MRRILAWSLLALVLLAAGVLVGAGWYYSEQLLEVPVASEPELTVAILASDEAAGTVTLPSDGDPDLLDLGHVGLLTRDGLLLLDDEVTASDGTPASWAGTTFITTEDG